jgi:hypothetical protein
MKALVDELRGAGEGYLITEDDIARTLALNLGTKDPEL